MKTQKNKALDKFRFITERTLRQESIEITRNQSAALRAKLPKGIYWIQPTGRTILWCQTLLVDYLVNGDCRSHQALVEEFLAGLPQSA
jgi:hypothetical protein